MITSLRETLSARMRPPDAIFRTVSDTAKALTGAEGVALALRTGGAVVCRARSGNLAPEIGDKVDAGSGISGECLRTSRALRCDDTQTDDRVDPEVCRSLGIRSIAVVPLRWHDGTVGILEAFSPRAYAFGGEQISLLKRLAEIAQAAYEVECRALEPAPTNQNQTPSRSRIRPELFLASSAGTSTGTTSAAKEARMTRELFGQDSPSTRRYWIAGAAVLLLLTASVIWTTWHQPDEDAPVPQQTTQPQKPSDDAAGPGSPTVIPWKPPAGRPARGMEKRPLQNAAAIETERDETPLHPHNDTRTASVEVIAESAPHTAPDSAGSTLEAPPAVVTVENTEGLGRLASAPTRLPELDTPVSQGVIDATLVHKVQPVYPAEARRQRVEGSVVLLLTVGEDGSTRDLKVVSGPSLLVRAATEAVRQWRYRPAALNGKPIVAHEQITVIFKAPW